MTEDSVVEVSYRCLHERPLSLVAEEMTNFDHTIDSGLAEAIKDGDHMADYAGWEFHAYVYRPGESFIADVHRFHAHMEFVVADTPEELMEEVSAKWGAA